MKRSLIIALAVLAYLFPAEGRAAAVIEAPLASFPALAGKNPAGLRVFAADPTGALKPIPFQVDAASPAALAAKDRVLWMAADMGPRVDPGKWPAASLRWEAAGDAAGSRVAYLTWEENPPPPAARSYLKYDAAQDAVETDNYQIGFSRSQPIIQDRLVLKSAAQPKDILDRFKIRMKLAIKNFFDFSIDEGGISSQLVKAEGGPIRATRSVTAWKKIGPVKLIPKSRTDFIFYPDWVEVKTQIVNPIDGPKILDSKTSGASGFDLNAGVLGSRFDSNVGGPLSIDGKADAGEADLAKRQVRWWSLSGAAGALIVRVDNDPKLAQLGIEPAFVLADDAATAHPPEEEKGGTFIGFDLPYQRIPKGEYQVKVLQVFPRNFAPGQEETLLKEAALQAPASVRALPQP